MKKETQDFKEYNIDALFKAAENNKLLEKQTKDIFAGHNSAYKKD